MTRKSQTQNGKVAIFSQDKMSRHDVKPQEPKIKPKQVAPGMGFNFFLI